MLVGIEKDLEGIDTFIDTVRDRIVAQHSIDYPKPRNEQCTSVMQTLSSVSMHAIRRELLKRGIIRVKDQALELIRIHKAICENGSRYCESDFHGFSYL